MSTPNFLALVQSEIDANVQTATEDELVDYILGGVAAGVNTSEAQARFISLLEDKAALNSTDILLLGRVVGFLNDDVLATLNSRADQSSVNALALAVDNIQDPDLSLLDASVSTRATTGRLNEIAANLTLADIATAISNIPQTNVSNLDVSVSSRATPSNVTTAQNIIIANTDAEIDGLFNDFLNRIESTATGTLYALLNSRINTRATPSDVTDAETEIINAISNIQSVLKVRHYSINMINTSSGTVTVEDTGGKAAIFLTGHRTTAASFSGASTSVFFQNNTTVSATRFQSDGTLVQNFSVVYFS